MNYENIKKFVAEHRSQVTTLIACAVMFAVGFGTGKAFGHPNQPALSPQSNYTAKSSVKPDGEGEGAAKTADPQSLPAEAPANKDSTKTAIPDNNKPVPGQPCLIKGNISSSGKIYHVKGGASYDKVQPEACFNTEAEAVAAGFRKAKR